MEVLFGESPFNTCTQYYVTTKRVPPNGISTCAILKISWGHGPRLSLTTFTFTLTVAPLKRVYEIASGVAYFVKGLT